MALQFDTIFINLTKLWAEWTPKDRGKNSYHPGAVSQIMLKIIVPSRVETFVYVKAWWRCLLFWEICNTGVCCAARLGRKQAGERCLLLWLVAVPLAFVGAFNWNDFALGARSRETTLLSTQHKIPTGCGKINGQNFSIKICTGCLRRWRKQLWNEGQGPFQETCGLFLLESTKTIWTRRTQNGQDSIWSTNKHLYCPLHSLINDVSVRAKLWTLLRWLYASSKAHHEL